MSYMSERALNYVISWEQKIRNRGKNNPPASSSLRPRIKTHKDPLPQFSLDVLILLMLSTAILTSLLVMFLFYINKPLKEQSKEKLRYEFKEGSPTQKMIPGPASLEIHWGTPILHLNLESIGVVVPEFNAPIVEIIIHHYKKVMENYLLLSNGPPETTDFNRLFFDWQMDGGWKTFEHIVEIQKLTEYLKNFSSIWLTKIGYNQEFMNHQKMDLEIWGSVYKSRDDSSHFGKIHENSILSGIYYVKIPKYENEGQLIFFDPRGPMSPFDSNRLLLKPRPGDVIIFPSWLMHQVTPALDEEHISISWNIPGDWHASTNVLCTK